MTQQFRTDLAVERTAAAPGNHPGDPWKSIFRHRDPHQKRRLRRTHRQACRTLCYIRGSRHIPEQRRL